MSFKQPIQLILVGLDDLRTTPGPPVSRGKLVLGGPGEDNLSQLGGKVVSVLRLGCTRYGVQRFHIYAA